MVQRLLLRMHGYQCGNLMFISSPWDTWIHSDSANVATDIILGIVTNGGPELSQVSSKCREAATVDRRQAGGMSLAHSGLSSTRIFDSREFSKRYISSSVSQPGATLHPTNTYSPIGSAACQIPPGTTR